MNNDLIFISRMENDTLSDREKDFCEYLWNTFCIYFSHKEENTLYFYKTKSKTKETIPSLSLEKNSKMIKYIDSKNDYGIILYSYNEFINARTIKEIKKENNTFKKIEIDLKKLQDNFYNNSLKKQSVIITNEGTGKSTIVLHQIKPGEIYTAPDRELLKEKESFLKQIGKEFIRFYSNADIIYTTVLGTRNDEKIATRISTDYLDSCKNLDRNIDKNKLSDELAELSNKELSFIKNEISKLENEELECQEENSSISLIKFLKKNTILDDEEKEIIIDYYNYLISILVNGTKIITCTTHKLKILLQKMKYERRILIYCDEIINDIHGNAQILNKNIINPKTYNFISMITKLKETKNTEISESLNKKIEKMKNKRDIKNWHILTSYQRFQSLVEIKNNDWINKNESYFIILTTEEKSKIIFPEADFYDYRHHIYENNDINIICIDNFNSSIDNNKLFKGHERPLIVKSCAETIFDIEQRFYIADGVGHSLENSLPNIHNIRGTNDIYNELKDNKSIKKVGIALTSPHPENINLHKALLYSANKELQNLNKDSIDYILQDKEKDIISIILNDQFHQTVGRINGYRKTKNTKTFIFITSRLLFQLKPYYITKNIFHLSNFLNQKYFREKYSDIHNFLTSVNLLLNLTTSKMRNHKEEQLKLNDYIKFIIEKTNLKKYINISEDFLYSLSNKFLEHCKIYLNLLKEKLNKIKYIFHTIQDLSNRFKFFYNIRMGHMKLNNKIKRYIIVKSKKEKDIVEYRKKIKKDIYNISSSLKEFSYLIKNFDPYAYDY